MFPVYMKSLPSVHPVMLFAWMVKLADLSVSSCRDRWVMAVFERIGPTVEPCGITVIMRNEHVVCVGGMFVFEEGARVQPVFVSRRKGLPLRSCVFSCEPSHCKKHQPSPPMLHTGRRGRKLFVGRRSKCSQGVLHCERIDLLPYG